MRIGVDFDNTLVCYDLVFHAAAVERGLVPAGLPPTKNDVRDYLHGCGRNSAWTELQGYVYGVGIRDAPPYPGALDFLRRCREAGIDACIVSHKTRYPAAGTRNDLHAAARDWLERYGYSDRAGTARSMRGLHFEPTRQRKLKRIQETGCTHFVDDMAECLLESGFPSLVSRILFDPHRRHSPNRRLAVAESWAAIERLLLSRGSQA